MTMALYEHLSGPSYDLIDLEDTFQPDYTVESRQLTDREIQDFRYMFLDFCAYRVHDSN
jgi:hypothetical protein